MRKQIVLSVLAGLASQAAAQSASLSIVASQSFVDSTVTSSITLSVYAESDVGTHITGAAFSLSAVGGAGYVDSITTNPVPAWGGLGFGDFGDAGDGNHNGMIMGQITFLPFIQPDGASELGLGPVLVGSFTVVFLPGTHSIVEWTLGGGIGTFALEVIDVNANPGGNPPGVITQFANPTFGSVSINIPATSGLAVLGLGGLVAGRRRR